MNRSKHDKDIVEITVNCADFNEVSQKLKALKVYNYHYSFCIGSKQKNIPKLSTPTQTIKSSFKPTRVFRKVRQPFFYQKYRIWPKILLTRYYYPVMTPIRYIPVTVNRFPIAQVVKPISTPLVLKDPEKCTKKIPEKCSKLNVTLVSTVTCKPTDINEEPIRKPNCSLKQNFQRDDYKIRNWEVDQNEIELNYQELD